jgi:hypothetical protein
MKYHVQFKIYSHVMAMALGSWDLFLNWVNLETINEVTIDIILISLGSLSK